MEFHYQNNRTKGCADLVKKDQQQPKNKPNMLNCNGISRHHFQWIHSL